jgi:S-adenosylmethionine-diacylglycerol 3-amino-3-carboxypropyl transferase
MSMLYAQCWEDPEPLVRALAVTPKDDVLSIASAGDNSFALLLQRPKTLTAVDFNPAQLHLMELKMVATQLDFAEFAIFLGARPGKRRAATYRQLRAALSAGARQYWDRHGESIERGVIHCGRLERYLAGFRRWVLPLIHSRALISELLTAPGLSLQRELYAEHWDTRTWRWLFRLFFSRAVMARCGRRREWFAHVADGDIAETLLERTRLGLTAVPTRDNYFLEYMLTGCYRDLNAGPLYLRPAHFGLLRDTVHRIRLVHSDLNGWLGRVRAGTYTCFNLSDVFEYMPPAEADATWRLLVRSARSRSRLVYRTLFVPRQVPSGAGITVPEDPGTEPAAAPDRTFFYDRFVTAMIEKEEVCSATALAS